MVFFNYAQTNSWHDTPAGLIDAGATRALMQMVADAYEGALVVWEENNINMLGNRERAATSRGGGENGKGKGVSEEDPFDLGPNEAQRKVLDWLVEARYLPSPTLSLSCSPLANAVSIYNKDELEDIWAHLPQTPTKAKVRRPGGGWDSPSPSDNPTSSSMHLKRTPSKASTLPPTFSLNLLSRRPATTRSHSTPSPDTKNNTSASPWRLALSRSNTSNSARSLPASFQVSGSSVSPKKMWAALKTRVRMRDGMKSAPALVATLESESEGITQEEVAGTVNARLPKPPASPSPAPRRTAKRRNTTAVEVRAVEGPEHFGLFPTKVNLRAETKTMGTPAELKPHRLVHPPSESPATLPVNGNTLPLRNLRPQGVGDGVPIPRYNTPARDERTALGPQSPINPSLSTHFPMVACSSTSPRARSAQPFLPHPSTPQTPDLSLSLSLLMPSLVSATPSGYESLFSSSSALSFSSSPPPAFTNSKPERNMNAKEEEVPVTLWTLFVLTAFGYLAFFVLFLVCLCVGVWRMVGCFGTKDDED